MKRFILSYLLIFSLIAAQAQKVVSDVCIPGTMLIKYSSGGSSSGVIVSDSEYLYLVTARHCLINSFNKTEVKLVAPFIHLIYYDKDPASTKPDTIQVDLVKALANKGLLFDSAQDISILSIAKIIGKAANGGVKFDYEPGVIKLSRFALGLVQSELFFNFDQVNVGDDCLMFGFPSSLQLNSRRDYDFDRPLLRKGVIAGKDKPKGTIVIDCPSYQGNSGGPVFAGSLMDRNNPLGLIGIVSRSVLQVEELQSSYYHTTVSMNLSNSGYTVITPIEFAENLMNQRLETIK